MVKNIHKQIQRSFILKFINTLFGTRQELQITFFISVILGILYTFQIWEQIAILIIFGMILPCFYIIGLYRLIKLRYQKRQDISKFMRFMVSQTGHIVFMIIDCSISLTLGILVIEHVLDYGIIRFLLTILFPAIYIMGIHILLNEETYSQDTDNHDNNEAI